VLGRPTGAHQNPTPLNGREGAKGCGGTLRLRFGESGLVAPSEHVGAALLALVDAPTAVRCAASANPSNETC